MVTVIQKFQFPLHFYTQFRVILRVSVYSGSWLLAIITPKYKKIEDITEVGKLRLVKSRYMLPFLLWIKRNRASAASKKILEKMIYIL